VPIVVMREGERVAYRLHLEVPPTLLIAGAGHVGQALAELALRLDFHVVVIDDRADCARADRFPAGVELVVNDIAGALTKYPVDRGCYVVIVTRGHRHDHLALDAVIRRPVGYIGMIGSRRKSQMILRDLAAAGVPSEQLERVHTPIGMRIGAVTVSEIAVSIAAELVQVRRQQTPKLVEGPIELP
jgi:xanthine dehydrogenase accessory factor